ncbi:DDE-type integrase/transposase/recombinase, partial [Shigella sonnei]
SHGVADNFARINIFDASEVQPSLLCVYRIMRQNALLLERKPAVPPSKRAHTGRVAVKESNQRWCSDGFEFCCDNGERLRVTFALDCCDREALHWAVTTGGFNSETVQDVMLGAVERRFGNDLPS